jgi:hypothetical protein
MRYAMRSSDVSPAAQPRGRWPASGGSAIAGAGDTPRSTAPLGRSRSPGAERGCCPPSCGWFRGFVRLSRAAPRRRAAPLSPQPLVSLRCLLGRPSASGEHEPLRRRARRSARCARHVSGMPNRACASCAPLLWAASSGCAAARRSCSSSACQRATSPAPPARLGEAEVPALVLPSHACDRCQLTAGQQEQRDVSGGAG